MTINLYDIHRNIRQRERRNPSDAATRMVEMSHKFMDNPCEETYCDFEFAEYVFLFTLPPRRRKIYADDYKAAYESGDWYVDGGYIKTASRGWDPEYGTIYGLVSDDLPGCVKIGATTTDVDKRVRLYMHRHGLNHAKVIFTVQTKYPARIEEDLHERLKENRVSRPLGMNSNEWYYISAKFAEKAVLSEIKTSVYVAVNSND